jgi:hypothetical protein
LLRRAAGQRPARKVSPSARQAAATLRARQARSNQANPAPAENSRRGERDLSGHRQGSRIAVAFAAGQAVTGGRMVLGV